MQSLRTVLFTTSDETNLDYISDAMESFSQYFKDELVPAAIRIVDRLVSFLSFS